jgi:general secretion pathway protein N
MRVEGVAPRTWLLATVAGWALVLWVLSLLGLGEYVQLLPDDPSLAARLPQLAAASPERLGPLSQYAETSARPLFSEDRRPQPFSIAPEGDANAPPAFDFILTSVLLTPTLKMAIVQPSAGGESTRIKLGDAAAAQPSWRLTALNPRSAIFDGPDGQKTLDLRVYDGTGGESPTADHATSQAGINPSAMNPAGKPGLRPAISPSIPNEQPASSTASPESPVTPDAQVDSIRKRIEERRAQLRQDANTPPPAPAVKNP